MSCQVASNNRTAVVVGARVWDEAFVAVDP